MLNTVKLKQKHCDYKETFLWVYPLKKTKDQCIFGYMDLSMVDGKIVVANELIKNFHGWRQMENTNYLKVFIKYILNNYPLNGC